jgi:hypothetical protein
MTRGKKAKKVVGCSGNSWTCISKWVGGWNVCLCPRCNDYATAVIAAHERKRAERRDSGLVDIRTDRFNALARVVEPIAKLNAPAAE